LKGRKGRGEERSLSRRYVEGEPQRPEGPGEQRPRPGLNNWERREARFTQGEKAVEAQRSGRFGLVLKRKSGEEEWKRFFDLWVGGKL